MNGKSPSSGAPIRSKTRGCAGEHVLEERHEQRTGTTSRSAIVRGSRRSCGGRARAVARGDREAHAASCSMSREERLVEVALAGPLAKLGGRRRRRADGRRAAGAASSQRSASSITWLDTSSVVPCGRRARGRSPRGRAAAPGRARRSARRARAARARRAAPWRARRGRAARRRGGRRRWSACRAERDRRDHLVDAVAGRAEHAREVAQVLADGEVAVHRRRLRHVADPAAQRRRARRLAEHVDAAAGDDLHADDRAHERRLAAAARAEQAGDGAGTNRLPKGRRARACRRARPAGGRQRRPARRAWGRFYA